LLRFGGHIIGPRRLRIEWHYRDITAASSAGRWSNP
jgi:hypothetical protein